VASVHLGYKDGKRRRKDLYGATRREVAQKLKVTLGDQQQGRTITIARLTVGDFLDHWMEQVVRQRVRESTFQSHEAYVRLHLKPGIGHIQLNRLTPQDVQAFLNQIARGSLSARSVQYVRSKLCSTLNQALKWDLATRNVATLVEAPRSTRAVIRPLIPEQEKTFLGALRGDRFDALITVAIATGLRQGELLALRWTNLDLAAGELRVRYMLRRVTGEWRFLELNMTLSRRTISLAVAGLVARRERQEMERQVMRSAWRDWGLVSPSTVGTPLDASNVTHRLKDLLAHAGLPRQRFHDLRGVATHARGASASGDGDFRPKPDQSDHEYLQPRHAGRQLGRR
jgi:integrase